MRQAVEGHGYSREIWGSMGWRGKWVGWKGPRARKRHLERQTLLGEIKFLGWVGDAGDNMIWKFPQTVRWTAFGLLLGLGLVPISLFAGNGVWPILIPLFGISSIGLGYDLQGWGLGKSLLVALIGATLITTCMEVAMTLTNAPGKFAGREEDWGVAAILCVAMFIAVMGIRLCVRQTPDSKDLGSSSK